MLQLIRRGLNFNGWTCIIIYCLFTSISAVWVSSSFSSISGSTLTFFTLLLAQVFFLLMSIVKKSQPLQFVKENKKNVFIINVLTLTSWLFMFMALQRIEASVESAIYQGWVPVIVLLIGLFVGQQRFRSMSAMGPFIIALFIFMLVAARIYSASSDNANYSNVITGILLASLAGSTGGVYVYFSSRMHINGNASTVNILATRFFILLMVTGFLARHQLVELLSTNISVVFKLTLLSILFVIIPIFCLQYSISELGAVRVSVITPLVPVIALAVEYIYSPWSSIIVPVLIVMVCFSLIMTNLWISSDKKRVILSTLSKE
ncbi:EamA/RhaT family transporter [Prodigiosinella confusarubida]|uniref:EamA/RhaT family transporter n=1 Tax=Serratia sp. (strain ATCC 39006) TaxID=104623 RepID=A0A2I5T907_SERS3|nr:DMT family transporter [Serratia sp. ATCC 39006]AUH01034.1 EamA/RhaT family transporter [Serratia sp. ATCC 39006]AUH05355.1 EamA/RhaT family transporter [Serratia sp. ATCC 39006]